MGSNLPATRPAAINWVTERLALWNDNAAAIGLTTAQVAALTAAAQQASVSQTTAYTRRSDAKSATRTYHDDADAMRSMAAAMIATIKAYAESTGDDTVYALANISPKDPPSPVPAPEAPASLSAALGTSGEIILSWKATNPTGTYYVVRRKLGGLGTWENLGDTGGKEFIDDTIPQGTASVLYQVFAKRGTQKSPGSTQINVSFGVGSDGQTELSMAA